MFESGSKDGSGSCEKNVSCYPAWSNESDAVARVLLASGDALCSGSLLNNTSQNFRAYILTAFHCVDLNEDGSINSSEISNAENWMFQFHYKTTSCTGSYIASTITYNHDNFRAAWNVSDFALLELVNSPLSNTSLSFLGWDNTGTAPTKGTCIHHPQGDVMKISFDSDSPVSSVYNTHWFVDDWEIGSTEPGSSGSPLLDQNKRVIGQDHMGDFYHQPCDPDKGTYFGKFSRSWTGGGTNSTRLSYWLDQCNTGAATINTIRGIGITGPSMVCTANSTFTLHNKPPGSTVTWTASRVTPSSGSGTTATFHTTCTNIGDAQVTFTILNSCGSTQVSKAFLSGGPGQSEVSLFIQDNLTGQEVDPWNMCKNSSYYIYYINNSNCSTSNYNWTLPYGMTQVSSNQNWVFINTNSSDGGILMLHGKTCCAACGSNVFLYTENLSTDGYDCGGGWYMSFTPNPTANETTLELKTEKIAKYTEGDEWEMEIYSQQQVLTEKVTKLTDSKHIINTTGWKEGIYFVHVKINNNIYSGKFIVAR